MAVEEDMIDERTFTEVVEALEETLKHCEKMEYDAVVIMLRQDIHRLRRILEGFCEVSG